MVHPEKAQNQLESLGFSPSEARVYLSLLQRGEKNCTGYQIARELNLSRSSVYAALDSLVQRGAVFAIPGETGDTRQYQPEQPETLLGRIRKETEETARALEGELKSLRGAGKGNPYLTIDGRETIFKKTEEILSRAQKEVFINTDFPLDPLFSEMEALLQRGIRILLFSFQKLDTGGLDIEFYHSRPQAPAGPGKTRLMAAVDHQAALIAGRQAGQPLTGIFSENPLLVSIVSEHIHHDIYLLRLREHFGHDPSEPEIRLSTHHEELTGLPRLKP